MSRPSMLNRVMVTRYPVALAANGGGRCVVGQLGRGCDLRGAARGAVVSEDLPAGVLPTCACPRCGAASPSPFWAVDAGEQGRAVVYLATLVGRFVRRPDGMYRGQGSEMRWPGPAAPNLDIGQDAKRVCVERLPPDPSGRYGSRRGRRWSPQVLRRVGSFARPDLMQARTSASHGRRSGLTSSENQPRPGATG